MPPTSVRRAIAVALTLIFPFLIAFRDHRDASADVKPGPQRKPGKKLPPVVTNAAGIRFVLIPQGSFVMGSEPADTDRWNAFLSKYRQSTNFSDERPSRRVTLTRPFYMGRFEVTQRQWRYVAEKLPQVKRNLDPAPAENKGDELPVEMVSWEACEEFVLRLNRLNDGFEYALPTEAEWEYACRAGTTGDYAGNLDAMGWYADNSGKRRIDAYQGWSESGFDVNKYFKNTLEPNGCATHPVGRKRPNAFGLYDMYGNVMEWCADWYDENHYATAATADPTGPDTPRQFRVQRGGSWLSRSRCCRSACRSRDLPTKGNDFVGFRVVIHVSGS